MELTFTRSPLERLRARLATRFARAAQPSHAPELPEDLEDLSPFSAVLAKPRLERVEEAFTKMPLQGMERRAMQALIENPHSTSVKLSRICGWSGSAWRAHMILVCQRRRHMLWPGGLGPDTTNGLVVAAIIDYDHERLLFRMKPEFEDLFRRQLGLNSPAGKKPAGSPASLKHAAE
jgi:hypothetical protein